MQFGLDLALASMPAMDLDHVGHDGNSRTKTGTSLELLHVLLVTGSDPSMTSLFFASRCFQIHLFLQPSRSSQNHWDLLACWRFGHCQFGHWVDLRTDTSSRSALSRRRRRQGQHHEDMEATDGTARHGAGGTLSSAASEPKRRMSKRLTG